MIDMTELLKIAEFIVLNAVCIGLTLQANTIGRTPKNKEKKKEDDLK